MKEPLGSTDLFGGNPPTPEVMVRRLYWLINWHVQRRRVEVASRLGIHRNTLHRYCNPSDLSDAYGGGPGGKLSTTMRIVEALDLNWLAVQAAISNARTENEMIELAHRDGSKASRADTPLPGDASALPA